MDKNTVISRIVILINVVLVVYAIIAGHFTPRLFGEHKLMTMFSSIQILAIAAFSLSIFFAEGKFSYNRQKYFWLLAGIAFIFFAVDEYTMIHENIDFSIHKLLNIKETNLTDHLDDAIIGLYGIIAAVCVWCFRKEILRDKCVLKGLIAAAAIFSFMVLLDIATNGDAILRYLFGREAIISGIKNWAEIAEEVLKLAAEAVILLCFISRRLNAGAGKGLQHRA
ncbi:MAG: hypothetical protein JXJ19_09055 [Elusimicrobia bacterium]|nr:hypothetical protein [Elusimicrobiota bacterium]